MRCQEFLGAYPEAQDRGDGGLPPEVQRHLEECPRCARYARVVDEGCRLVRTLPRLEVSERFEARLDHRLLQVDEDLRMVRERGSISGATVAAAAALAVLLGAVAWSPALRNHGVRAHVQLPPIVAAPPQQVRTAFRRSPAPDPGLRLQPLDRLEADLWAAKGNLLYEYSPLKARYSAAGFASTAIE